MWGSQSEMTHSGTDRARPWGWGKVSKPHHPHPPGPVGPLLHGARSRRASYLHPGDTGRWPSQGHRGSRDDPPRPPGGGSAGPGSRPLSLAVGMEVTEPAGEGYRDQQHWPPRELVGCSVLGPESALWQAPPPRCRPLKPEEPALEAPARVLVRRTSVLTRDSLCFPNSQGHVALAISLVSL